MTAQAPRIVVCGVGGAGVNTIAHLRDLATPGIELLAIDTSHQALARLGAAAHSLMAPSREVGATAARRTRGAWPTSPMTSPSVCRRLLLRDATRGLGTGGDADAGRRAAHGVEASLAHALRGADLVFVVAGLAGGTGGGAGPEVARFARREGAVVVGCGIWPFGFETPRRQRAAATAGKALAAGCDAWLRLDNRRASRVAGEAVGLDVALRVADDVVRQAVQGIGELVGGQGTIDVDLAVVQKVLTRAGRACVALGSCARQTGSETPAQEAMDAALASPLCDMAGLSRARGVLLQVSGGLDLSVADVAAAVRRLESRLPADCELVVGVACREGLAGSAQVMLLGTGLCVAEMPSSPGPSPARRPRPIAPALPVSPGALAPPPPLPAMLGAQPLKAG